MKQLAIIIFLIPMLCSCSIIRNITTRSMMKQYGVSGHKHVKADSIYTLEHVAEKDNQNNISYFFKTVASDQHHYIKKNNSIRQAYIMVHGAKKNNENHFETLFDNIWETSTGLDIKKAKIDSILHDVEGIHEVNDVKMELKSYTYSNEESRIIFYDVNWSNFAKPKLEALKQQQKKMYTNKLAKVLENSISIDYLGELALYLNKEHKEKIWSDLGKIFVHVIRTESVFHKNEDIEIIAGAMGAKLIHDLYVYYDTYSKDRIEKVSAATNQANNYQDAIVNQWIEMEARNENSYLKLQNDANALSECLAKIKYIWLLSNQLNFLNLSDLDTNPKNEHEFYKSTLEGFSSKVEKLFGENGAQDALRIINFLDPNDVVSYPLIDNDVSDRLKVVNIELKNNLIWKYDKEKVSRKLGLGLTNKKLAFLKGELMNGNNKNQLALNIVSPNQAAKDNRVLAKYITQTQESPYDPNIKELKVFGPNEKRMACYDKKQRKKIKRGKLKTSLAAKLGAKVTSNKIDKMRFHLSEEINKSNAHFASIEAEHQFNGLYKEMDEKKALNLILVHGMRSKKTDFMDGMVQKLVGKFNMVKKEAYDYQTIELGDQSIWGNPQLIVQKYINNSDSTQLNIFKVYWSPFTSKVKSYFKKLDERSKDNMSLIPYMFKNELINDGLIDVILTLNNQRGLSPEFMKASAEWEFFDKTYFSDAFGKIFDKLEKQDEFLERKIKDTYFITGSLGSYVLLEYLRQESKQDIANQSSDSFNNQFLRHHLHSIIMLSNQLPLIDLKNEDPLWRQGYPPLDIISFEDPNDILSFKLDTEPYKNMGLHVKAIPVNVGELRIGFSRRAFQKNIIFLSKLYNGMLKVKPNNKASKKFSKEVKTSLKHAQKEQPILKFAKKNFNYDKNSPEIYDEIFLDFLKAHEGVSSNKEILDFIFEGN